MHKVPRLAHCGQLTIVVAHDKLTSAIPAAMPARTNLNLQLQRSRSVSLNHRLKTEAQRLRIDSRHLAHPNADLARAMPGWRPISVLTASSTELRFPFRA
jgi:hypothetical protein